MKAQAPELVWKREFTRERDGLIIAWLREHGMRLGELIQMRISDIDFRANEVTIHRDPDAPDDPRRDEPTTRRALGYSP